MKIEIYLSEPQLHSLVIEALSAAQLIHRVEVRTLPDPCQEKSLPLRGLTTVRNCQVVRRADSTLECMACGKTLPATPTGELDTELVASQIALRQW